MALPGPPTLYSSVSHLKTPDTNILKAEAAVEPLELPEQVLVDAAFGSDKEWSSIGRLCGSELSVDTRAALR